MNRVSGQGKDLYLHTGGDSHANISKISFVCDWTEGFLFKYNCKMVALGGKSYFSDSEYLHKLKIFGLVT